MKLIIILIAINIAFGGRCPPKEVLSSCTCDQDTEMIICQETLNRVSKVFNWMSKNLDFNEMHFKRVKLYPSFIEEEYERIIQDDTFGDITFEEFQAHNVSKIGSNAFNITAHKIKKFECFDCSLVNQPPKYNLFKVINLMINLNHLSLRLNVTEIPANAIQPFNGQHSNISFLVISSIQSLTIKSGAFHNFIGLEFFSIWDSTIKLIEKDAFKLQALDIEFQECNLKGKLKLN